GVSGGIPFSGDDWFSAGVSMSVPLWAAQNQAPRLRAARAEEAAAKASFHATLRNARERLEALYSAHEAAQENFEILEAKQKSLRELVEAARRNYEAGRGSYLQVLDGEAGLLTLEAQIEAERARILETAARANSFLVSP
ncbi:MAG: TolC family protein, partial [Alphaproteobacteria bacterium]